MIINLLKDAVSEIIKYYVDGSQVRVCSFDKTEVLITLQQEGKCGFETVIITTDNFACILIN